MIAEARRRYLSRNSQLHVEKSAEYTDLFEAIGVGAVINPRDATAEEIIRFTREGHKENVVIIDHDRAEILEIEIDDESVLAGRQLAKRQAG